jgi:hypothetical protein
MEILNTEVITEAGGSGLIFIPLGILAMLIGAVVLIAALEAAEGGIALIGLLVVIAGILVVYHLHDVGETSYKQYEVIVEDFNEIYDNGYEIVDQDGKIVTIKKEGAGE